MRINSVGQYVTSTVLVYARIRTHIRRLRVRVHLHTQGVQHATGVVYTMTRVSWATVQHEGVDTSLVELMINILAS